jgi:hypothetical protein
MQHPAAEPCGNSTLDTGELHGHHGHGHRQNDGLSHGQAHISTPWSSYQSPSPAESSHKYVIKKSKYVGHASLWCVCARGRYSKVI